MGTTLSLYDRIVEAFAQLGSSGQKPSPGDAEAPSGEDATGEVHAAIRRSQIADHFVRLSRDASHDCLCLVGRPVELTVSLESLFDSARAGRRIRFFLGEQEIGEALTTPEGAATLIHTPDHPGFQPVSFTLAPEDSPGGEPPPRQSAFHLQAISDGPLAIIDADLLVGQPADAERLAPIKDLGQRGWHICYVDMNEQNRAADLRAAVAGADLPPGALLLHPLTDHDAGLAPRNPGPVLAIHSLRRLRMRGIPAVLVITDKPIQPHVARAEGIEKMSPPELAKGARAGCLEPLAVRARRFVTERDRAEAGATDQRFQRALDQMTRAPAVAGNSVSVELDNRAARRRLFELIAAARSTVHLQAYILKPGRLTERLVVRLVERARAGVKVRFTVDALYAGQSVLGSVNPVIRVLRDEPGIEVVASDPITMTTPLDSPAFKERDHRKLLIVDGEVCIVSGRNLGDEYYHGYDETPITDSTAHEQVPWLDAHVELRGPLVEQVQKLFLDNWLRNGGAPPGEDEPSPATAEAGEVSARLVSHDGLADTNALAAYEAIVSQTRRRLLIVNDFPVVATLANEIFLALRRGVEVDILTGCALTRRADGTFFAGGLHRKAFEFMSKRRFEPLLKAGARIHELSIPENPWIVVRGGSIRPYVHAKVVVADSLVVSVGSANLDATASYWEREANVVVEDAALAASVEGRVDALLARSYRLDPDSDYWKGEAVERAVVDSLWPNTLYA